jgi:hypothetical protein
VSAGAILGPGENKAAPDEAAVVELFKFGETSNGNHEPSPEDHVPHSAHQGLFNERPASSRILMFDDSVAKRH